jgi:hypothetical protein
MKDKKQYPQWEYAGSFGVDAGLCWIGDPCYCVTPDCTEHPAKTWSEFCDKLETIEKDGISAWPCKMGHNGLGVCVSSGYGDGEYPVYVKRQDGRIKEVRIKFF